MTRETRISLLVGLAFVVMFGLVLSELTGVDETPATVSGQSPRNDVGIQVDRYTHVYPVPTRRESPRAVPRRRVVQPRPQPQPRVRAQVAAVNVDHPRAAIPEVRAISPAAGWQTYRVQAGDTLIDIARKHYGQGNDNLYVKILQANRSSVPDAESLRIGQVLRIPPVQTQGAAAPAPTAETALDMTARPQPPSASIPVRPHSGRRTHVVTATDTLPEIAWKYYRNDTRESVMKIYDANRTKLYGLDHLPEGMVLVVPN